MDTLMRNLLKDLFEKNPNLFPSTINIIENIKERYQSFRQHYAQIKLLVAPFKRYINAM